MKFFISPYSYLFFTILLLTVPLPWLSAWLISVAIHECCHWLAVSLCGEKINSITVGIGGAEMECGNLSTYKRLFCILSGPILGMLPIFLQRYIPKIAVCCWILSLYNLLPIYPLDGGRALQIVMQPHTFYYSQIVFLCMITAFSIYTAFFLNLGILPIFITCGLWIKSRNTPCK